jgi:hypothetical protein
LVKEEPKTFRQGILSDKEIFGSTSNIFYERYSTLKRNTYKKETITSITAYPSRPRQLITDGGVGGGVLFFILGPYLDRRDLRCEALFVKEIRRVIE